MGTETNPAALPAGRMTPAAAPRALRLRPLGRGGFVGTRVLDESEAESESETESESKAAVTGGGIVISEEMQRACVKEMQ